MIGNLRGEILDQEAQQLKEIRVYDFRVGLDRKADRGESLQGRKGSAAFFRPLTRAGGLMRGVPPGSRLGLPHFAR